MSEAVAIVGMSCLFPGAHTVDEFWEQLLAGRDCTSQATARDLGLVPETVYGPEQGRQDRTYCLRGGYVRDFAFDPAGYRLPPSSLPGPDHPVSWSLHTGRQALLDAGAPPDRDLGRCGLVLGNLSFPTRESSRRHARSTPRPWRQACAMRPACPISGCRARGSPICGRRAARRPRTTPRRWSRRRWGWAAPPSASTPPAHRRSTRSIWPAATCGLGSPI